MPPSSILRRPSRFSLNCRMLSVSCLLSLSGMGSALLIAAEPTPVAETPSAVGQKQREGKASRLLNPISFKDAASKERTTVIVASWFAALSAWHAQHDEELRGLWSEWSKARAVVPKDGFPGEVVAYKIDAVYGSLKPAYQSFLSQLATELSAHEIDGIKERWSRSPGRERTYKAYLEIVPDLTEEQKKVIHDRLLVAREAAMLTDSDKEIVNLYKIHKVKVEEYVGSLQWTKLHKAYAKRGKAK